MNINRYVPILINTLDTIVRWVIRLTNNSPLTMVSIFPAAGKYWILLML